MGKYFVIFFTLLLVFGGVYMLSRSTSDSMKELEETGAGSNGNSDSGKEQSMYNNLPEMAIDTKKTYTAVMTTAKGVMKIVLDPKETPVTVNNFVFLAREGYYDGTIFHRVMENFMIQGGDPTGTGTGSPGYRFKDEPVTKEYTRGTIAMANSGPNTNGSQFFIMHKDYKLPKSYVIFGAIDPGDAESLKTLDAIASIDVEDNGMGEMSKPREPVTVERIVIEEM